MREEIIKINELLAENRKLLNKYTANENRIKNILRKLAKDEKRKKGYISTDNG